jgi:hypothetical protein
MPINKQIERETLRERLKNDAAAWPEYRANGKHLTDAEADAWMAQLESCEATKFPRSHG